MIDNKKVEIHDCGKMGKGLLAMDFILKVELLSSWEGGEVYFADKVKVSKVYNISNKKIKVM